MSIDAATTAKRHPAGKFILGVVLLVLAVIGIVMYATGTPDLLAPEGNETGVARGITIVLAAACGGTGVLLIVLGLIQRGRAVRD